MTDAGLASPLAGLGDLGASTPPAGLDPVAVSPEDISVKLPAGVDALLSSGRGGAALSLAGVVAQLLNGAVHEGGSGGGSAGSAGSAGAAGADGTAGATPVAGATAATGPDRPSPLSPAAFASLRSASYAACLAAVVLLRDPVLLFACLVTLVTVFFGEWWFLYVASAIPLTYHISTTFNFLNGGMVPHVLAAASALNNMLNMVFVGVSLIAAWPSLKRLAALDFAGAWASSGRFAFILSTVSAKIVVENAAAEAIATFFVRAFGALKDIVGTLISVLWFLPGVALDAVATARN